MKNNNAPLVSIIVPCYKVEQYIKRCVSSLLEQSMKDIEIILVDDGSPDNVPALCDEYEKQDLRISVIHKQNEGLGLARNSGLEVARGEYVAFIDSDDYIDVTMFETLYREATKSNADAVFCGFNIEAKNGIWIERREVDERTVFNSREAIDAFMLDMIATEPYHKLERRYWMSVWHAIYKRDILNNHKIKFLSERVIVSEDLPFQCEFLINSSKIVYLPDCYYYYCLNGTSLSKTFVVEKFSRFKALHHHLFELTKHISSASLRVDRLYIGYIRSLIVQMFELKTKNYDEIIDGVLGDSMWLELRERYSPSYLPFYPRLFYYLILNKQKGLIIVLSKCVSLVKNCLRLG